MNAYHDPDDGTPIWQHVLAVAIWIVVFVGLTAVSQ